MHPNATMTMKHTPPRTCFAFLVYGKGGGVAIINPGVGVASGSAAGNSGRTSSRESIKLGTFSAGQYYYCQSTDTEPRRKSTQVRVNP